ncbi:MAG: hypothetical protein LBI35_09420 [Burkholderiales bacterium]|jgi:hypothetical protein|nr:hypothetical protein [Burkholderiales bacterium]
MQNKLFFDDEHEALALMVSGCAKGTKALASYLFPHLKPESAYARLKACLNPEKDERLTFGQIIAAMKFCGSYEPLLYACDETMHSRPKRIELEDQKAALMREYIAASKTLIGVVQRIEAVEASR